MRVSVSNLRKTYGRLIALDGITIDLERGITGLLGPNGAGKTTLLRCLATVVVPDSGSMEILGLDPEFNHQRTEIRRRLGYFPQEPGFYLNFTCFEFVDYLAILKEFVNSDERLTEVRRVLEATGLSDKSSTKIRHLSGGMRRRLVLAQALVGSPEFLVLDEPTAGLDPELRFHFRELISELAKSRIVILSTHQTEDVAAICDRVIVLTHGRVQYQGRPGELIGLAAGRVWLSQDKPKKSLVNWRTTSGLYRAVGDPPQGAQLIDATIEDGYLTLVGAEAVSDDTLSSMGGGPTGPAARGR